MTKKVQECFNNSDCEFYQLHKKQIVPMIEISSIGYPIENEAAIESGSLKQVKPAGNEAFLVWNSEKRSFYLVNADQNGFPINYMPA